MSFPSNPLKRVDVSREVDQAPFADGCPEPLSSAPRPCDAPTDQVAAALFPDGQDLATVPPETGRRLEPVNIESLKAERRKLIDAGTCSEVMIRHEARQINWPAALLKLMTTNPDRPFGTVFAQWLHTPKVGPIRSLEAIARKSLPFPSDDQDVEDALTDAYLAVLRYVKQGRLKKSITGLLRTFTRRRALDLSRKRRTRQRVTGLNLQLWPSLSGTVPSDFSDGLRKAISQLDAQSQVVIELFYIQQKTVREIAESLEKPAGTVKSRLSRAREQLRRLLIKDRGGG